MKHLSQNQASSLHLKRHLQLGLGNSEEHQQQE